MFFTSRSLLSLVFVHSSCHFSRNLDFITDLTSCMSIWLSSATALSDFLASASALSLPCIPMWLGTQLNVTDVPLSSALLYRSIISSFQTPEILHFSRVVIILKESVYIT